MRRPARDRSGPRSPRSRARGSGVALIFGAMAGAGLTGGVLGMGAGLSRLPDVSSLATYSPYETTKVFDIHHHVVAEIHGDENRVVVPLRDIPATMQDAVIAIEDSDFYHHHGINFKSELRALITDILHHGEAIEGGSTLTQQLAKNLFLTPTKALPRKLAEAYLALQIEHRFTKQQILELYLNQVYWGDTAYGIEAAAQNYFGVSSKQLDLAQSAMLAGLLRGPSLYSPYHDYRLAKIRQGEVLRRMVTTRMITAAQASAAYKEALHFPGIMVSNSYRAPYFVTMLEEELVEKYGADAVLRGGMTVNSTLDLDMQDDAERLVKAYVAKYGRRYDFSQMALVAIDPHTGGIRAMVGGVDFTKSKFNRVTQALRQPGSSFKPFLYLTAWAQGFNPAQIMNDDPVSYDAGNGQTYTPHNYDNEHMGNITLREALWRSNNIIAVKLMDQVGVENVIETAHRLGISSPLGDNLSLALGTSEVTPLEMASAYGVLANDGVRVEPVLYTEVEDRAGAVLELHRPQPLRVFPSGPVRTMVDVMRGVILHGTAYGTYFGRPAAGKTGTTSDHRDAWFVGFTPDLVCAVWAGNDDNHPMAAGTTGGDVCAPLWSHFMRDALQGTPPTNFPPPPVLPPPSLPPASMSLEASDSVITLPATTPSPAAIETPSDGTPSPDAASPAPEASSDDQNP